MRRSTQFLGRTLQALAGALALVTLASCGGGGVVGSGGTGVSTGLTVGTVSGFGSVIVDGVTYDNHAAPVVSEVAPSRDAPSEVRLGDRVALEYRTAGVASLVRVEAALSGTTTGDVAKGRFSMLGQTVLVNASGSTGPITQFGGGYGQGSDLRAGDAVEVHGVMIRQGESTLVQATRIDKLAAVPEYLRVTGVIDELRAGVPMRITLGALVVEAFDAALLPASTPIAKGQTVTILAAPGALTMPGPGTWRLQAAQVRIVELRGSGPDDTVSGSVSRLDPAARTLALGSVQVDYSAAAMVPATSTLANGQYVVARGMFKPGGILAASSLTIRDAESESEAVLRGNIRAFDPASGRFIVRDVLVDPSGAKLAGCPPTGLADGQFVAIEGLLSSNGVVARKIQCKDEPADASVERGGLASAVDVAGLRFSLAPRKGPNIVVRWTATTYFGGVTPASLAGKVVQVEGLLAGDVLVAGKIKAED